MSHPSVTGSGPVEDRDFLPRDQEGFSARAMTGVFSKDTINIKK